LEIPWATNRALYYNREKHAFETLYTAAAAAATELNTLQ
jgi:hypothetical protein